MCPQLHSTYRLPVVAEQHQACLSDDAGSASSRNLQGLPVGCGTVIHQTGAIESHFLQNEWHKTDYLDFTAIVLLAFGFTGSSVTSVLSSGANYMYQRYPVVTGYHWIHIILVSWNLTFMGIWIRFVHEGHETLFAHGMRVYEVSFKCSNQNSYESVLLDDITT